MFLNYKHLTQLYVKMHVQQIEDAWRGLTYSRILFKVLKRVAG